jgi:hypothetical protein
LITELYGLQVDFVTRNGHFMVLTAPAGLKRDQLSAFQMNMLLTNKIPHLLELQVEELDQSVTLYYNITGKRMLTHWMRTGDLTIKQFFSLLYQIADIVSASNIYMLVEGRYILKEDFIYCNEDGSDIHLTYVPKETLTDKNSLSADFQQLSSGLVHKVSELSGNGYQELMNYLSGDAFNLPELKLLLLKHMNRVRNAGQGDVVKQHENKLQGAHKGLVKAKRDSQTGSGVELIQNNVSAKPVIAARADALPQPFATPAKPDSAVIPPRKHERLLFDPEEAEGEDEVQPTDRHKKLKLPVMLVGFLGLCLIWKLYADHQEETWVWLCSGASAAIVYLVYKILWKWNPPLREQDEFDFWNTPEAGDGLGKKAVSSFNYESGGILPFHNPKPDSLGNFSAQTESHGEQNAVPHDARLQAGQNVLPPDWALQVEQNALPLDSRLQMSLSGLEEHAAPAPQTPSYYQSLPQHTTVLSQPDRTVLLKHTPVIQQSKAASPYLEWIHQGATHKKPIEKQSFVIGRAGPNVELEHSEEGVSRFHAEIVKENENYTIKDLGSRNGTTVNAEVLVPYRIYALQNGDIVKIINTEFIFKMV